MSTTVSLLVLAPSPAPGAIAKLLSGAFRYFTDDLDAACAELERRKFDAVVTMTPALTVARLRATSSTTPIIALVPAGDLQAAHEAGCCGVDACIGDTDENPIAIVERVLARRAPAASAGGLLLASLSPSLRGTLATLEQAARSDVAVLLRGESGTGKTMLARYLHERSARSAAPFVVVSCPALPPELLASELFGHARGAFTGAVRDATGRVEVAARGTLFLDEVGDLSPPVQALLLRFLQDRTFERVGETTTRHADVRIVAATHRNLEADVAAGRFRLDLFYRLNVVDLVVPPLRDRREDVPRLAEFMVKKRYAGLGCAAPAIEPRAAAALMAHSWPGNVRELENEIERALALSGGPQIRVEHLSERIRAAPAVAPFLGGDFTLAQIEREHIHRVVQRARSFEAAAEILGIDDSTLWRKRKRFSERDTRNLPPRSAA